MTFRSGLAWFAGVALSMSAQAGMVGVSGSIDYYWGPAGTAIGANYTSWEPPFVNYTRTLTFFNGVQVDPTAPYAGYEDFFNTDPDLNLNAGTAGYGFDPGTTYVDFATYLPDPWNEFSRSNVISIVAAPLVNVVAGEEFLLATLHLENGSWFASLPAYDRGTGELYPDSEFGLTFTTYSSDPLLDGHTFSATLVYGTTPGTAPTPDQADAFYFREFPGLGSIRIFEYNGTPGSNAVDVKLYGKIGSLTPTKFDDLQGNGFLSSSTGVIPGPPPPTATPEPATWALMVGAVALLSRRRPTA